MLNKSSCLDIITVYAGAHPEILLPSADNSNANNFKMNSFKCLCGNKAMICETVQSPNPSSASLPYKLPSLGQNSDEQLYEMMRVGGGMVLRNQRVLQIKALTSDQTKPPPGPKPISVPATPVFKKQDAATNTISTVSTISSNRI